MVVRVGLGLAVSGFGGLAAPFSIVITGLTDGYAVPGTHASISYTLNPSFVPTSVKWSNSSDQATSVYGTAANPSDFTAGDFGSLYLHIEDADGNILTKSAPIQILKATAGAAIDPISVVELATMPAPIDLAQNYTANGNDLTYTVSPALPSALECSTDGELSGTPGAGAVADAEYVLTATDLYLRRTTSSFNLSVFETAPDPFSDSDWSIEVIGPGVLLLEQGTEDALLLNDNGTTDRLELEA